MNYSLKPKRISLFMGLFLCCLSTVVAQKTHFTVDDVLRMKSFNLSKMTDDGRYLAGTISATRDRLNVDHSRYGDPNYITPRKSDLVILDTDNGKYIPVLETPALVRGMEWSPDNKTLAFLVYDGEQFNLQLFDLQKRRLSRVKLKTDKKISSGSILQWTPDGKSILLSFRETGWAEKADSIFREATVGPITVYDSNRPFLKWDEIRNFSGLESVSRVDIASAAIFNLLPEARYSSLQLTKTGSTLLFQETYPVKTSYNREGGAEYAMFAIDWMNGSRRDTLVKKSKKRISANWRDDKTAYAYADSGKLFIRFIDQKEEILISKDTTEVVKKDTSKVKFSVNRWSPDGKSILATSKKGYWIIAADGSQMEMVYEFPEEKELAPNLSIVDWSPNGQYWYMSYSAKDKWERGLVRYDLRSKTLDELVKDDNLYSGWRLSKNGERLFYNFSNGDLPTDLYVADPDFTKQHRLTDMNSWITEKKLTHSELVKYRDSDGKELYGILYYPVDFEEGKSYPLVCEIYEQFFNNGFSTSMNLIANAGYFGFKPSVNLIQGYPGEAWVKGVTSAINMQIERGLVDPDQLGVHGTSYGGYATSLLISQTDRFAAAINISGKVNIISFLGDSPRIGTRNYAAAENGQDRIGETLWEDPMKYINTSAVLFADRITTPHLLLTGEGDWNVPATNTREMYYALRRLGKEVVWVNYVGGGHGAGAASNESDYHDHWNRILSWYKTYFEKSKEKKKSK